MANSKKSKAKAWGLKHHDGKILPGAIWSCKKYAEAAAGRAYKVIRVEIREISK